MRATTIALTLAAALAISACGSDDSASPVTTAPTVTTPTDPSDPTTTVAGEKGWLGGEPTWTVEYDDDADGGAVEMAAAPGADVRADTAGGASAPASESQAASSPRAGSVDDNARFDDYLAYRQRITELGISLRGGDPTGRVVVHVTDANDGGPAHGAVVTVTDSDGNQVAALSTTADGTARFMPAMWSQPVDGNWTFTVGDVSTQASAGATAELAIADSGADARPVALDVLFLLDATGSMGDEIDQLKVSIDSVADRVAALDGAPDVRMAMTVYRDEGDAFVTSTYDFTSDIAAFRAALADVVADGGGDYPEALDEAFGEAITSPSWRDPATTLQLVFLVADAPPHVERQISGYDETLKAAVGRGIKVFPVASSESDDQAEAVFRQIAQATGARFVFLSYGAAGAATGAATDIDSTDYEELALDDLVVRLVAEEVAALTGDATVVPPPASTTTTISPQQ